MAANEEEVVGNLLQPKKARSRVCRIPSLRSDNPGKDVSKDFGRQAHRCFERRMPSLLVIENVRVKQEKEGLKVKYRGWSEDCNSGLCKWARRRSTACGLP